MSLEIGLQSVKSKLQPLAPQSLVVIGLARDCEKSLHDSLFFCEALEDVFASVFFILVENDSKDKTRALIEKWSASRENVRILTPIEEPWRFRTERISKCRNLALDTVRREYADNDMLLMIDLDIYIERQQAMAVARAAQTLGSCAYVAGVFPNSFPVYYDVYALRHDFWCPTDVWQDVDEGVSVESACSTLAAAKFVHSRQLHIPADLPPIEVQSAFGGAGLYRLEVALRSNYKGVDDRGLEVCEHVEFNRLLNGKLLVLPYWCVHAPYEHISSAFHPKNNSQFRIKSAPDRPAKRCIKKWFRRLVGSLSRGRIRVGF